MNNNKNKTYNATCSCENAIESGKTIGFKIDLGEFVEDKNMIVEMFDLNENLFLGCLMMKVN